MPCMRKILVKKNKPHVQIINYKVDFDAKGHVGIDNKNVGGGENEQGKVVISIEKKITPNF